jgi:hypothetical protein
MPYLPGDARSFTNWGSSCLNDEVIKKSAKITNDYEYRRYLQKNAGELIRNGSVNAYTGQLQTPVCKHCGKISLNE